MSPPNKKKPPAPRNARSSTVQHGRAAPSAQLRAQTRKVLGKHYRSKYGVR